MAPRVGWEAGLTGLSPGAALLVEEVVQQLVVRAGDDVHVLVAHQEAGAAAGLQGQGAGQLQDVCCCTGAQQPGRRRGRYSYYHMTTV